jgi:hypothetical protein
MADSCDFVKGCSLIVKSLLVSGLLFVHVT